MGFDESSFEALEVLTDDFVTRYRRGERPSIEEYATRYPEHAEAIRDLFPALIVIETIKPNKESRDDCVGTIDPSKVPSPGRIGDYRIIREIGRGGMGVVYEAIQESLGRRVALKVLPRELTADRARKARFEREARAAARLHHTNIVPVFAVGDEDQLHFYAMQYIHGQGLDVVLRRLKQSRESHRDTARESTRKATERPAPDQPTPDHQALDCRDLDCHTLGFDLTQAIQTGVFRTVVDDGETNWDGVGLDESSSDRRRSTSDETRQSGAVGWIPALDSGCETTGRESWSGRGVNPYWECVARIGSQAADALHHAHEQGILHRDIKPSNLLLDHRGNVWVTDFGLAKASDQENLTETGDVLGTIRYMAPECFRGKTDRRSDVYSLGMTLYELLVLRPGFDECDRGRLIHAVAHESPQPLRSVDASIPRDLETIVTKSIERDPSQRYASAADLADDLRRFLRDEPIRAKRVSVGAQLSRWYRKHRPVALLSMLAAALLLLVLAVLLISQVQLRRQRDQFRDALAQSLVAESRFHRVSGEAGQRADSLASLRQAASLSRQAVLRDEVIQCLALHDLDRLQEWQAGFANHSPDSVAFDGSHSHYVSYSDDAVEIRRVPRRGGEEGEIVASLPLEDGVPRVARFSRDGQLLVLRVNDDDRSELRVWRWRQAEKILSIRNASEKAFDVDREGRHLVCGLRDRTIKTLELATGNEVASWEVAAAPFDLHFERQGSRVACAIPDAHRVDVYDSQKGSLLETVDCGEDIYSLAWHPDGKRIAVGRGFNAAIVTLDAPSIPWLMLSGHRWMVHSLEFHPGGEFLVTHSLREGITRCWDVRTTRELVQAPGHFVCFNGSGSQLAFVHNDAISLASFLGEQEYQTLADPMAEGIDAWRAVRHPDHELLVECGRHGVRCWDLPRRRLLAASPRETVYTLCFDPGAGDVLTAGEHGLQRWPLRVDGGSVQLGPPQPLTMVDGEIVTPEANAFGMDCTPDGRMRVAAFRGEPFLYVQDVRDGRVRRFPCEPTTAFIAISPDGRWIAAGNYNSPGFDVWDTEDAGSARQLASQGSAAQVVFSPDGKYLVACANDRYLLFEVGTWRVVSEILRPTLIEGSAAFSPDGRTLALSMGPSDVELRSVESGDRLATLSTPRDPVNILNVTFDPSDSQKLYLACGPYGIRIWDLAKVQDTLAEVSLSW